MGDPIPGPDPDPRQFRCLMNRPIRYRDLIKYLLLRSSRQINCPTRHLCQIPMRCQNRNTFDRASSYPNSCTSPD